MGWRQNKVMVVIFVGLIFLLLSACGSKSQEGVVKKINEKAESINGYKAKMEMTMKTGKENRNYHVDVWHKREDTDFYRVKLENEDEKDGQVILKNKEGVFVLTPALNKSFKFQADWPENNSQPYIYQSIVNDVVMDKNATFTATEDAYIFNTKTNYKNNTHLPYQEIYFDKKTFLPTAVNVMNDEQEVLISVAINGMELEPSFAAEDFDKETILEKSFAENTSATGEERQELEVLFPLETNGAELAEKQAWDTDDSKRVIMTYKGDQHFTLIQEKPESVPTSGIATTIEEKDGDLINLGHSVGVIKDNAIEWNYGGTDFFLASDDMTSEELINVASSIQGQEIK